MSNASNDMSPGESEMLAELRSVIDQVDGPPPDVVAAAKASFTWRTVDAELADLAELTFDSLVDEEVGTLVRSAEQPRLLTFTAAGVEIEVEATLAGHRFRLLGQIVPPATGQLTVRQPGGPRDVAADDLGRFTVEDVSPGPVSFQWRPADGPPLTTEWITL